MADSQSALIFVHSVVVLLQFTSAGSGPGQLAGTKTDISYKQRLRTVGVDSNFPALFYRKPSDGGQRRVESMAPMSGG